MKLSLSVLALTISHAYAASLFPRSTLETLVTRQSACDSACAPFQATLNNCASTSCLCTATVASSLQVCVNCAVTTSPTATVITAAQGLISNYQTTCSGAGLAPVTVPATSGSSSAGISSVGPSTTTTNSRDPITVSSVDVPVPTFTQVVVRPSTDTSTPTNTSPGGGTIPGLSGGALRDDMAKSAVVVIGVIMGMVLVM